jgi:hypothetical protein
MVPGSYIKSQNDVCWRSGAPAKYLFFVRGENATLNFVTLTTIWNRYERLPLVEIRRAIFINDLNLNIRSIGATRLIESRQTSKTVATALIAAGLAVNDYRRAVWTAMNG